MAKELQFQEVFQALKSILQEYAQSLDIKADTEDSYYLDTFYIHPSNKKPIFFGAAKINKNYVSYHLMPIYACPELLKEISPDLKKRMQGKSCFNFKRMEPDLFKELKVLTEKGIEKFKNKQLV